MLPKEISEEILSTIQPWHVFSGDDHDHCHIQHLRSSQVNLPFSVWEDSVPTFSWTGGILRPGFALLELKFLNKSEESKRKEQQGISFDEETKNVYAWNVKICFLPSQVYVFLLYIICAVGTIFCVLLLPLFQNRTYVFTRTVYYKQRKLKSLMQHFFTSMKIITCFGLLMYLFLLILI
jgi:hypothetical protein